MKTIRRNKIVSLTEDDKDRLALVTIIEGNIVGSLLWANDGSLYQVQDGQWYKLTVVYS